MPIFIQELIFFRSEIPVALLSRYCLFSQFLKASTFAQVICSIISIKFCINFSLYYSKEQRTIHCKMYFDKNTQRKSFKNHQSIKRKCFCPFQIFLMLIVTLILQLYIHFPSSIQNANSYQQAFKEIPKLNATQLYLKNYCDNSSCQQQNIDALASILSLMQNQPQIVQSPPPKTTEQIDKFHATLLPSQNIQNLHQLQINSNTSAKLLFNYYLSPYEHTNGQSKLIQIPLFVIKHHKVTTPIQYSFAQKITSLFKHFDSYQNIDKIASNQNEGTSWNPNARVVSIAVRSNKLIHPKSIEIEAVSKKIVSLQLIGLNISIDKNIFLVPLGRFEITEGKNYLTCLQPQCNEGYQALIFKFPNTSIGKIRIFQSISE